MMFGAEHEPHQQLSLLLATWNVSMLESFVYNTAGGEKMMPGPEHELEQQLNSQKLREDMHNKLYVQHCRQ